MNSVLSVLKNRKWTIAIVLLGIVVAIIVYATGGKKKSDAEIRATMASPFGCSLCQSFVTAVDTYIQANPTSSVQKIKDELTSAGSWIIDNYVPAIVTALQTVPADQVCLTIGLCSSPSTTS